MRNSSTDWGGNDYLINRLNVRLWSIDKYLVLLSLPLVVIVGSVLIVRVFTLVARTSLASVLRILVVPILVLRSVVVSIIGLHATTKLLLEQEKDLLYKLKCIWLLKKVDIKLIGSKLLPLIVEISLIFELSLLLSADFRKLIICHIELLALHGSSMEL